MKAQFIRAVLAGLLFLAALMMCARLAKAQTAESTYRSKCVACHGSDGSGNTAVGKSMHLKDLSSADVQKMSDAELTTIITDGKDAMPAYKDKLTGDQIKALVAYIRGMAKKS